MAATQAYRSTVSQYSGATRLRTNRTYTQHSQTTFITTTQSGPISQHQSSQYVDAIGCSTNEGNGSTIGISTITSAQSPNRVSKKLQFFFKLSIPHKILILLKNVSFSIRNSFFSSNQHQK